MNFFKYTRIEFLYTVLKTKRLLLVPPLYLLSLFVTRAGFINSEAFSDAGFMDYWIYLFNAGDPLIYCADKVLPILYLSKIFLILFIVIGYIEDKLKGYNLQLLIRQSSKKTAWRIFICTGIYYAFVIYLLSFITTVVFCLCIKAKLKFTLTPSLMFDIYDSLCYELNDLSACSIIPDYMLLLLLPFVCTCALISLFMLLSLILNSIMAFVILNFLSVLAIYLDFPAFSSIYVMINRSAVISVGGASPALTCIISFLVIIGALIIGENIFFRTDLISKDKHSDM